MFLKDRIFYLIRQGDCCTDSTKFFSSGNLSSLAVGSCSGSGNSSLPVGMPCAFYSQHNVRCNRLDGSMGFLGGTTVVEVILVKGNLVPSMVKVHPIGFDPLALVKIFTPIEVNKGLLALGKIGDEPLVFGEQLVVVMIDDERVLHKSAVEEGVNRIVEQLVILRLSVILTLMIVVLWSENIIILCLVVFEVVEVSGTTTVSYLNRPWGGHAYHKGGEIHKENKKESMAKKLLVLIRQSLNVTTAIGEVHPAQILSPKDKTGLGYDSQLNERNLNNKSDVFKSAFDSSVNESEEDNNQANDRRNFVPIAMIKNSGKVPVNTVKQSSPRAATSTSTTRYINTAATRPTVNVVSAIKENGENSVKSSACWIWRPTGNVIDHISKYSGSYMLKRFNYGNPQYTLQDQGIFDSGCSRKMTGNKSFLTDYQEIDGGFVAFGGSLKGGIQVNAATHKLTTVGDVAFLKKPTESEGFEQIVDFLNANPIKYALTVNPTISTSCIQHFWDSAKVKSVNEDVHIRALVDRKKIIITEASIRRDLRLDDAEGTACLPNAAIFEELARMATMASALICLANNQKSNFTKYILDNMRKHKSRRKQRKETKFLHTEPQPEEHIPTPSHDPLPSSEDRMQLSELMEICTKLSGRVLSLEQIKTNQAVEIKKLKKRVKKLKGKKKKRTHGLKRLYKVELTARVESFEEEEDLGDQEDASKQGMIDKIDDDEDLSLIDENAQD
nr:hypothetical protein [Tanacetum cinerariifolium]